MEFRLVGKKGGGELIVYLLSFFASISLRKDNLFWEKKFFVGGWWFEGKFSVSFGPKSGLKLWIWTWTKLKFE